MTFGSKIISFSLVHIILWIFLSWISDLSYNKNVLYISLCNKKKFKTFWKGETLYVRLFLTFLTDMLFLSFYLKELFKKLNLLYRHNPRIVLNCYFSLLGWSHTNSKLGPLDLKEFCSSCPLVGPFWLSTHSFTRSHREKTVVVPS
jgi:hypothetical protein